jgi:hypothetical protein
MPSSEGEHVDEPPTQDPRRTGGLCEFKNTHAGHVQVDQQDVEHPLLLPRLLKLGQRLGTAGRERRVIPQ